MKEAEVSLEETLLLFRELQDMGDLLIRTSDASEEIRIHIQKPEAPPIHESAKSRLHINILNDNVVSLMALLEENKYDIDIPISESSERLLARVCLLVARMPPSLKHGFIDTGRNYCVNCNEGIKEGGEESI